MPGYQGRHTNGRRRKSTALARPRRGSAYLAEQMTDEEARYGMLQVAQSYEIIAGRGKERIALYKKHTGSKS